MNEKKSQSKLISYSQYLKREEIKQIHKDNNSLILNKQNKNYQRNSKSQSLPQLKPQFQQIQNQKGNQFNFFPENKVSYKQQYETKQAAKFIVNQTFKDYNNNKDHIRLSQSEFLNNNSSKKIILDAPGDVLKSGNSLKIPQLNINNKSGNQRLISGEGKSFQNINFNQRHVKQSILQTTTHLQDTKKIVLQSQHLLQHQQQLSHLFMLIEQQQVSLVKKYQLLPDAEFDTLNRNINIQNCLYKFIKDVEDHFKKQSLHIEDFQILKQKKEIEINQMKEENGMIIDQLNIAMKGIDSQDSFRREKYSKQNEQTQRYINLENQKLKLQLGDLSKKIKEMQTDESVSALKEKLQKIEKQMSMVIEEYEQQMNSKDQQLKTITQKLIMTNGEVQKQNITISRNEQKISEQAEIIEKLQEKTRQMQQLREILMMQREDFIQLEIKNVQKQQALFEVNKKCGRLEERLTKFEKKQEEGLVIPENPNFGDQKYFFQNLNKTISENETFSKYLRINFPDINYDIVEKKLNRIQNWIEDNKHDRKQDTNSDNPSQKNFNINKFTVYRPTFFSFIEKQYNLIQKSQPQILRPTIIKPQFLQLMRSILDAKYNEFLQVQNYQCYSKFGDFVYSFLGNFKIDPITLKIVINKEIQGNSKLADDVRVNFYIDLMSPLLDQIWDVVIFREFLNEDSSNDELFFFLHVRNLIFKGPQMNHNCASFHPVHFIKWEHAEYCIQKCLNRFQSINKKYVIDSLQKKYIAKNNGRIYLIDSSLVIRTLLEYFRSERHQKYKIIRDLFFNQQGQTIEGRFSINFEGFRNLFENENFLNTNELEKAYLYRQCYSLGRGVVSPEVFFAVITDSNFLTKHLIFKSNEDLPTFDNEKQEFQPNDNQYKQIFQNFYKKLIIEEQDLFKILNQMLTKSQNQGLEDNYKKLEDLIFKVSRNFEIKENDLNGLTVFQYFAKFVNELQQFIVQDLEFKSQELCEPMIEMKTSILTSNLNKSIQYLLRTNKEIQRIQHQKELECKNKLKKFQKLARFKMLKYYQLVQALLNTKLNNQQNQTK